MPSPGASRPPRVLSRVESRQVRRKELFTRRLGTARRPADRLLISIDYLRGAASDADPAAVEHEVDQLVRQVVEAVGRLHKATLRPARPARPARKASR
ncbi:hypothetical protein [Pseudofrankia inefficax]|uniref:Uncharacterized protein n=1 Tax=Pseudofrankia inefficax (strain DSM 45817 / CECT 9037 / DDB 130130 / EuI1c) TaxID=298654 RepID=E3IX35_PSEI1|nr:hypothetical protein [Pseudofrankia inefficax]ADP83807.1 hypothetical protein FraEuI1c_5823 [Pseudofrankia inefficax]